MMATKMQFRMSKTKDEIRVFLILDMHVQNKKSGSSAL